MKTSSSHSASNRCVPGIGWAQKILNHFSASQCFRSTAFWLLLVIYVRHFRGNSQPIMKYWIEIHFVRFSLHFLFWSYERFKNYAQPVATMFKWKMPGNMANGGSIMQLNPMGAIRFSSELFIVHVSSSSAIVIVWQKDELAIASMSRNQITCALFCKIESKFCNGVIRGRSDAYRIDSQFEQMSSNIVDGFCCVHSLNGKWFHFKHESTVNH